MKTRSPAQYLAWWIATCVLLSATGVALGQTPRDAIEVLRGDLKADRKAFIAENLVLTPQESEAFWPVYRRYRAEVDTIVDGIVKLVLEYADVYPNVPEDKAQDLLTRYTKAETKLTALKTKYLKKFKDVLPPSKVFRFAQLDNRLDLGMRLGFAASIPLLPAAQTTTASTPLPNP